MNSDTIWLSETDEETILYIVKNMKKSVFAGLDHYKTIKKKQRKVIRKPLIRLATMIQSGNAVISTGI